MKSLIDLTFSVALLGVAAWQIRTFFVTGECSLPRSFSRLGGNPWWLLFLWMGFAFCGLREAFYALT